MTFDEIADVVEVGKVYSPNPAHTDLYDRMFKEFKTIYKRNRRAYARLNKI